MTRESRRCRGEVAVREAAVQGVPRLVELEEVAQVSALLDLFDEFDDLVIVLAGQEALSVLGLESEKHRASRQRILPPLRRFVRRDPAHGRPAGAMGCIPRLACCPADPVSRPDRQPQLDLIVAEIELDQWPGVAVDGVGPTRVSIPPTRSKPSQSWPPAKPSSHRPRPQAAGHRFRPAYVCAVSGGGVGPSDRDGCRPGGRHGRLPTKTGPPGTVFVLRAAARSV